MILAMTGFITFLLIVALIVAVLEYSRRRHSLYVGRPGEPSDRDRDRLLDDLRAHHRG